MNSDPAPSYGREVLSMIDKLLERYPEIDGIFLDQLCYDAVDTVHDDGVTMYRNKAAYMLRHCYEAPVSKLTEKIHHQGKLIFSNSPVNIEVQKDVDGHMAEGSSLLGGRWLKYLCIAKPLLFHTYYKDAGAVEDMLQQCVLYGASYSVMPHPSEEIKKIFEAYLPLLSKLKGRKWILELHPIKLPGDCRGNIFRVGNGEVVISLIGGRRSISERDSIKRSLSLKVCFAGWPEVGSVYTLGTHYRNKREVLLVKEKDGLLLTIPEHSTATVVVLK